MSILIKGMEMPKNCFECPWRCKVDPKTLLCRINGEYFEETFSGTIQNRHKSCPLVPVPPHGRLIDEDELWVEINKICDRREAGIISDLTCLQQILSAVRHTPTIIEAEEGET